MDSLRSLRKEMKMTESQTKEAIAILTDTCWTPDEHLTDVQYVDIKNEDDLKKIPEKNGNYWIATDEPINHSMFNGNAKKFPQKIGKLEIVYNGIAQGLQSRARAHLLRKVCEGMSGISVDLFMEKKKPNSHVKAAYSSKKKVPYINGCRVTKQTDLENMGLSSEELEWLKMQPSEDDILFWNGINVSWPKHEQYTWRFYYYQTDEKLMSDIIENKWRERYGKPRLCSYNEGR